MKAIVTSAKNRTTVDKTFVVVKTENTTEVDGFQTVETKRYGFQLVGHVADKLPVGTEVVGNASNEYEIEPNKESPVGMQRFQFKGIAKPEKETAKA